MKFASLFMLLPALTWGSAHFEPNRGQAPQSVNFVARTQGGVLSIEPARVLFCSAGGRVEQVELDGANRKAPGTGLNVLPAVSHYALDHDPAHWVYGVPHYSAVLFSNVYPGVDLRYHADHGNVEFDFEVAPYHDASRIRLRFQEDVRISAVGDLVARGGILRKPGAWQTISGRRHAVDVRFKLAGRRRVRFVLGPHDSNLRMTIDPVVDFATYLGGSNNEFDTRMIVDKAGSIYMAGTTYSADFPASLPAGSVLNLPVVLPDAHVYISRLKPDGSALDWSLFIGGTATERCAGLAQDSLGNIYLFGTTSSPNFPVTPGVWRTTIDTNLNDEFVVKLDARTGRIQASTFLGVVPRNPGEASGAFAVDLAGGVYVSSISPDDTFQTTPGTYITKQPAYLGALPYGSALMRFNASLTARVYATYIDLGAVEIMQVDGGGNAVFAGHTNSPDPNWHFPALHPLPGTSQNGGGVYIAKLNPTGTALIHASLLHEGFEREAAVTDILVDANGNEYLTGYTSDSQFPQVNSLTLEPIPPNYPPPDVWPSPFLAEVPSGGGHLIQSTWLYGPEYTTPGGTPTATWIKLAKVGTKVCVAGIGIRGVFTQTAGGLGGTSPDSSVPVAGSTLACINNAGTHFDLKTTLPYTEGAYSAVASTPDGALLFAGVATKVMRTTAGVVQPSFGGGFLPPNWYTLPDTPGDTFLMRVSLSNPAPRITAVYPDSVILNNGIVGTTGFDLTGAGFAYETNVTFNAQPVTSTFISTNHISITGLNYNAIRPGPNQVGASLSGPGGGISDPVTINAINASPSSIRLLPSEVTTGTGATNVMIFATNLSPSSALTWGGTARAAKFVAETPPGAGGHFELLLNASELAQPSVTAVTVTNPAPGGGVSSAARFVVQPVLGEAAPSVTGPQLVAFNGSMPTSTLTLGGVNFAADTRVYWDGSAIPASFVSTSQITVTPPAGSLSRLGAHDIYVANGSLSSNTLRVHVARSIPGGPLQTYDAVKQRLYVVKQASYGSPSDVLTYDAATGAQLGTVAGVITSPTAIAASDDGRFLYVAGGGTGREVRRWNTGTRAIDLDWQVEAPLLSPARYIQSLIAVTGSPETLVVSLSYPSGQSAGPNGIQVVIFDRNRPRFLSAFDAGIPLLAPAIFATQKRIFSMTGTNGRPCWQWLDFDVAGVEGGNGTCGPEPAELVHDSGIAYLSDGKRTFAGAFPGTSGQMFQASVFLIDPARRMAYELTFQPAQLTALNLDSQHQTVTDLSAFLYSGLGLALYPAPSGGVLLVSNSALISAP